MRQNHMTRFAICASIHNHWSYFRSIESAPYLSYNSQFMRAINFKLHNILNMLTNNYMFAYWIYPDLMSYELAIIYYILYSYVFPKIKKIKRRFINQIWAKFISILYLSLKFNSDPSNIFSTNVYAHNLYTYLFII